MLLQQGGRTRAWGCDAGLMPGSQRDVKSCLAELSSTLSSTRRLRKEAIREMEEEE